MCSGACALTARLELDAAEGAVGAHKPLCRVEYDPDTSDARPLRRPKLHCSRLTASHANVPLHLERDADASDDEDGDSSDDDEGAVKGSGENDDFCDDEDDEDDDEE